MSRILTGIQSTGRPHLGNLLSAVLFASVLAPQMAHSQVFKTVELGSYVLSTNPQVRQQGGLYLQSSEKLLIRDLTGQNTAFSPRQVSSFRIGKRQFVSTGGFQLHSGFGNAYVTQAFAEQLDSGQVVLLRYRPLPTGAAGRGNISYNDEADSQVYLLRSANALTVTPMQAKQSGAAFRVALRPYLASRPDLTQLLEANNLKIKQLPAIVYALNHNQPYNPATPK